tara:strand:+ start:269 stop:469 length:201 start_codon:yes stop_codon:yes gene_type:complete
LCESSAIVTAIFLLAEPSIDTDPDTSPDNDNVLAEVHFAADATADDGIDAVIADSWPERPSTFATV